MMMGEVTGQDIARALPFPQPRFWFGDRVKLEWEANEIEYTTNYWQQGVVTGLSWNLGTQQWNYVIYWEDDSEGCRNFGYDPDQLLVSERDLFRA